MTTVAALIERLQKTYKPTDHIAAHIWCTDDVIIYGEQEDKIITQAEAEDIIEYIDDHIDSELGITWVTIDCAINEYPLESEKDHTLDDFDEKPEVDDDPNHHALPEDSDGPGSSPGYSEASGYWN